MSLSWTTLGFCSFLLLSNFLVLSMFSVCHTVHCHSNPTCVPAALVCFSYFLLHLYPSAPKGIIFSAEIMSPFLIDTSLLLTKIPVKLLELTSSNCNPHIKDLKDLPSYIIFTLTHNNELTICLQSSPKFQYTSSIYFFLIHRIMIYSCVLRIDFPFPSKSLQMSESSPVIRPIPTTCF